MQIILNGEKELINSPTIASLLLAKELDPKVVVVELNGKIIPKTEYDQALQEGDSLELVQFVGGG